MSSLALLIARLRAVRPFSHRVGVGAALVSLLIMLAQPDAQAVLLWLLGFVGLTKYAHLLPLLTHIVGGITVLAALFSHPTPKPKAPPTPPSP